MHQIRSALLALMLAATASITTLSFGCRSTSESKIGRLLLGQADAVEAAQHGIQPEDLRLAAAGPLAFLRKCLEHYDRKIADYRCTFVVQECLNGALGPEQVMAIKFRERPYSVDVRWLEGAIGADRVNYVAGRSTRGDKKLAHVKPNGLLGLLTPGGVMRDIHAVDVRAAARRTIDQFGFRNTLALFVQACEWAEGMSDYALEFVGIERFDDHVCYVIERRLPPGRKGFSFPDRLQRMYVDVEWLVPRACFAYADESGTTLLGSYIARDVEFNVGLKDDDFAVTR